MTLPTGSDLGAVSQASARQLDALRALLPADFRDKHDDGTLARFLVARDGNAAKAAEMLVVCESWRKSRSLDDAPVPPEVAVSIPVRGYRSIADANLPGEETGLLPEYCHRLNKYWAGGGYHGFDRAGQPVYIERLGYHDAKGLAKHVKVEEFVDWHIRNMELFQRVLLKECEDNSRRRALARGWGVPNGTVAVVESGNGAEASTECVTFVKPKMTAIFDCAGMGFHQFHLPALKFAQAVSELDQKYYPETLNMLFIVNAPRMFVSVWSIIKKWLNQSIVDKISILGGRSDYQPVLTKYIPEYVLPTFLGGTCTCSHIPGGCVPSEVLGNIKPVRHSPGFSFSVPFFRPSCSASQESFPRAAHVYRLVVNASTPANGKDLLAIAVVRFRTTVAEIDFEVRKRRKAGAVTESDGSEESGGTSDDDVSVLPQKKFAADLYPVTVRIPCADTGEYLLVWELPGNVACPEPTLEYAVFMCEDAIDE